MPELPSQSAGSGGSERGEGDQQADVHPNAAPTAPLVHGNHAGVLSPSVLRALDESGPPRNGTQPDPNLVGFRVTKRIGSGGQGIVYDAVRDAPRQAVAIKVPIVDDCLEERCRQLRKEADLLANLSHPNIIKVYEVVSADIGGVKAPCVVLELVEEQRCITDYARSVGLTQRERIGLVMKIAGAVQHMHERLRAFHRDLKPGNILVGRDGEPRLIDVGMAASGDLDDRFRERGWALGTYDYMAPEQFHGDTAYLTQRTDVYALGVILFELLTGELPYAVDDLDVPGKKRVIVGEPPRKLEDHCTLECPGLARVVEVALRKETSRRGSDHRWETPRTFADQLENALAGRAVGPAPGEGGELPAAARTPGWREYVSVRRIAGIAATVALAVVVGRVVGDRAAESLGIDSAFERWAFRTVPPAVEAASLERVAVVGFRSREEVRQTAELLASRGRPIPAVDVENVKTWRPVYPALLDALAESGAAAVVFDIVFNDPAVVDRLFAKAAADAKFPVVVGLDTGLLEENAAKPLNAAILRPPIQWGGVSFIVGSDTAWRAELLLERDGQHARPMLALRAVASTSFRSGTHRFTTDGSAHLVRVDAEVPDADVPSIIHTAPAPLRLGSTSTRRIHEPSPDDQESFGFRDGDRATQLMIAMPPQNQLEAVTHGIVDLLNATPQQLREWVGKRAVFIANMTPAAADKFPYPDGREIWGVYGHAVAFEALATGRGIHHCGERFLFVSILLSAFAPAMCLGRADRGPGRSLVVTIVIACSTVIVLFLISYWLLRNSLVYCPVYQAAVAAAVSTCVVLVVNGLLWNKSRVGPLERDAHAAASNR